MNLVFPKIVVVGFYSEHYSLSGLGWVWLGGWLVLVFSLFVCLWGAFLYYCLFSSLLQLKKK